MYTCTVNRHASWFSNRNFFSKNVDVHNIISDTSIFLDPRRILVLHRRIFYIYRRSCTHTVVVAFLAAAEIVVKYIYGENYVYYYAPYGPAQHYCSTRKVIIGHTTCAYSAETFERHNIAHSCRPVARLIFHKDFTRPMWRQSGLARRISRRRHKAPTTQYQLFDLQHSRLLSVWIVRSMQCVYTFLFVTLLFTYYAQCLWIVVKIKKKGAKKKKLAPSRDISWIPPKQALHWHNTYNNLFVTPCRCKYQQCPNPFDRETM